MRVLSHSNCCSFYILFYIENSIDGLLTRSWIRPKAFVFLAYDQFIVMIANLCHYDLCFSLLHQFLLLCLFLELLMYIENIIDGLLTRSWIRPKAFVFLAYDQFIVMTANDQFIVMINLLLLSLWFVFLSVAILLTFLELLMKVMYAVKRLKLLHLIVFVFINFTRLQLCCFARV